MPESSSESTPRTTEFTSLVNAYKNDRAKLNVTRAEIANGSARDIVMRLSNSGHYLFFPEGIAFRQLIKDNPEDRDIIRRALFSSILHTEKTVPEEYFQKGEHVEKALNLAARLCLLDPENGKFEEILETFIQQYQLPLQLDHFKRIQQMYENTITTASIGERSSVQSTPEKHSLLTRRNLLRVGASAAVAGVIGLLLSQNGRKKVEDKVETSPSPTQIPTKTNTPAPTATEKAPPTPTNPPATSTPRVELRPTATVETPKAAEVVRFPKELSYDEVKPWIGKMRGKFHAILSEPLFLAELAQLPKSKRDEMVTVIAKAHAEFLFELYRGVSKGAGIPPIIGLDPGHGGSDTGTAAKTLEGENIVEKDLTWELSQRVAAELDFLTNKYRDTVHVIILRPQEPKDVKVKKDGKPISNLERLQKRVALLLSEEARLRPDPTTRGKNIMLLSLHFNDSPTEKSGSYVYYGNEIDEEDVQRRSENRAVARGLSEEIVRALRMNDIDEQKFGAIEDPYKKMPTSYDDPDGPYIILGSPKLDIDLTK